MVSRGLRVLAHGACAGAWGAAYHALVAREPGGDGFVALSDGLEKGVAKLVRD